MFKWLLTLFGLLFSCSQLQAVSFDFVLFVHVEGTQTKVEIYSAYELLELTNQTVSEAVTFLKSNQRGMGRDQIAIVATKSCPEKDSNALLQTIINNPSEKSLLSFSYSDDRVDRDLKDLLEERRKVREKKESITK